jgi:hypothetical protein
MSSTPSSEQQPAKQPVSPPERKATGGPIITPQVLAIIFGLILVIGVIVYYQMVIVSFNDKLTGIEGQITSTDQKIKTYEVKQSKLEKAKKVNLALREKLNLIGYLFLVNQDSVLPFYENTLFPIIESSRMFPGEDSYIEAEEYLFHINMAMDPFETLPRTRIFENALDMFPIEYHGEKNGQEIDAPLETSWGEFLHPYQIELGGWWGTYEDVQNFVVDLQTARDDILITVHCLANSEGDNFGLIRTTTSWTIKLTVYFMNPEASASGDNPPAPPGSQSC